MDNIAVTVDLVEYNRAEQFMMASKARLFGDDTALSAILASADPREQKRLGRQVRHFDLTLWQDECETTVLRGNLAKFSQNQEMRVALETTGTRRIAEVSPHNKVWGIGLNALTRVLPPPYIVVRSQPGQALERTREILGQNTYGGTQLHTPVPKDSAADDTVFDIDPIHTCA